MIDHIVNIVNQVVQKMTCSYMNCFVSMCCFVKCIMMVTDGNCGNTGYLFADHLWMEDIPGPVHMMFPVPKMLMNRVLMLVRREFIKVASGSHSSKYTQKVIFNSATVLFFESFSFKNFSTL